MPSQPAAFTVADLAWVRRKRLAAGKFGNGPASRKLVGATNRRILGTVTRDGVEYSYHATKGYRAARTGAAA